MLAGRLLGLELALCLAQPVAPLAPSAQVLGQFVAAPLAVELVLGRSVAAPSSRISRAISS
jgi:hypothetical protein